MGVLDVHSTRTETEHKRNPRPIMLKNIYCQVRMITGCIAFEYLLGVFPNSLLNAFKKLE